MRSISSSAPSTATRLLTAAVLVLLLLPLGGAVAPAAAQSRPTPSADIGQNQNQNRVEGTAAETVAPTAVPTSGRSGDATATTNERPLTVVGPANDISRTQPGDDAIPADLRRPVAGDRYIIVFRDDVADPRAFAFQLGRERGLNISHVYR